MKEGVKNDQDKEIIKENNKNQYPIKEFKINNFITLKLKQGKTLIYIGGKEFRQCKYLLLNIPVMDLNRKYIKAIDSIDEAEELLSARLHGKSRPEGLSAEAEFWGHCSNIQAWVEYNYDTRILHRNLSFSFLKRLMEVGDPKAKRVFKEEIVKRILSWHVPVVNYLISEGYLDYFNDDELFILIEDIKERYEEYAYRVPKQDLANCWNNYSIINLGRKELKKANMLAKLAIYIDPEFTQAWNNLGYIFLEQGALEDAEECLRLSLEIDPEYFLPWNNLALLFLKKEDFESAIKACNKALRLQPDFGNIYCHLGYAKYKQGETKKAIQLIRYGLSKKPTYNRGWYYLVRIYYENKKYSKLIDTHKEAMQQFYGVYVEWQEMAEESYKKLGSNPNVLDQNLYHFELAGAPHEMARCSLYLLPDTEISKVKELIRRNYKLGPILMFYLIWKDKVLLDSKRLSDYNIHSKNDIIIATTHYNG